MRERIDDALRIFKLVEVALALGLGTVLAAVGAGLLSVYAALPWWSVGLAGIGIFLTVLALTAMFVQSRRPVPIESPFTPVIEQGLALRARLATDATQEPTAEMLQGWKVRLEDWVADADKVVEDVAPHRLPAFKVDFVWADSGLYKPEPAWKTNLLIEIDLRIDRLSLLRVSL